MAASRSPPGGGIYVAPPGQKTFQYDEGLPSLPIPKLEQTLKKYLESVKPFVTEEEFRQTEFIVQQFGSGIGKTLHKKLLEKANHSRNWLEKWWEDFAYLSWRKPIAPLVNFTGPAPYMDKVWPAKYGTQIERASLVLYYSLVYWKLLRKQQIKPDIFGKTPWSMSQYMRIFNGCRTPGEHMDKLNFYFKLEDQGPCPTHIIVICRGRFFTLNVIDETGEPYTAPELQKMLQHVHDNCNSRPAGPGLGSLTSEYRTTWWRAREHLVEIHPNNLANLETIQTSIMTVCLDDRSPGYSKSELTMIAEEGLCGDCTNRWFDKTFNMIVYANGVVSSNNDHAPMDAIVVLFETHYCLLEIEKAGGKWNGSTAIRENLPIAQELVFKLDDYIYKAIDDAKVTFSKMVENIDFCVPYYSAYGRKYLRSLKLAPDTHMQMALQLAYYRMHNKPAPTYETASTRKFYNARTETMRTCTVEMVDWCKTMLDPTQTNEHKLQKYLTAYNKHNQLFSEAMDNHGVDRHLFGLQCIAMETGTPDPLLFTDPSYTKSGGGGNYILSTSFVGYSGIHGGVAPMCKNGYGTFYGMDQNRCKFFIVSWVEDKETDPWLLWGSLSKALDEMKQLLDDTKYRPKL
ncbi:unnamed protein product [Owenia fusiformis]|uniref:Peroxisomal carnitine O-octanoyltransferase n=1 Tax=Owenia fusiformis TaxID=6347 RepID=A0A8J1UJG1_OWEFU|nr:unnamed protein product [Owenia fusiformis]CAH1788914.1 unnamed protein product [Owenia fusiformis]